jgi:hypothetical protein
VRFLGRNSFAFERSLLLPTVTQLVSSFWTFDLEEVNPDVVPFTTQILGNLAQPFLASA